jgi:hypothetical protein
MDFSGVKYESARQMGDNPASVDMVTHELILNRDVFPKKSSFTRKFIKEHERGHLILDTDSEEKADEYALRKLYKSENKSLKKSIKALTEFLPDDDDRIETLYNKALEIDKSNRNNFMGNINIRNLLRGGLPIGLTGYRRNADGGDDLPPIDTQTQKKRFVELGDFFVTPFEIAAVALLFILVLKMK